MPIVSDYCFSIRQRYYKQQPPKHIAIDALLLAALAFQLRFTVVLRFTCHTCDNIALAGLVLFLSALLGLGVVTADTE
jgi:hypothetical protein